MIELRKGVFYGIINCSKDCPIGGSIDRVRIFLTLFLYPKPIMASKELPCGICFRCFNGVLRLFIVEYKKEALVITMELF